MTNEALNRSAPYNDAKALADEIDAAFEKVLYSTDTNATVKAECDLADVLRTNTAGIIAYVRRAASTPTAGLGEPVATVVAKMRSEAADYLSRSVSGLFSAYDQAGQRSIGKLLNKFADDLEFGLMNTDKENMASPIPRRSAREIEEMMRGVVEEKAAMTIEEQIDCAQRDDLLSLLRDYLVMNSRLGDDLASRYIRRIGKLLSNATNLEPVAWAANHPLFSQDETHLVTCVMRHSGKDHRFPLYAAPPVAPPSGKNPISYWQGMYYDLLKRVDSGESGDVREPLASLAASAETFRIAMCESGAINKVSQDLYFDQLRDLETKIATANRVISQSPATLGDQK